MPAKKAESQGPYKQVTLSVCLGKEGLARLDRCRALLQEVSPLRSSITRGEIVRAAIRSLLAAILADRADLHNPDDPGCRAFVEFLHEPHDGILVPGMPAMPACEKQSKAKPAKGIKATKRGGLE